MNLLKKILRPTNPRQSGVSAAELRARAGRSGFTLIEILVAVGAVAIVAVGLATIFESVGKTVATGKRLSTTNALAALLENELRSAFDNATRDGFLVIRHNWIDRDANGQFNATSDALPSFADQPVADWKPRRCDEILFFTRGKFTSSRVPLLPNQFVPRSEVAMVYIGHGAQRPTPPTGSPNVFPQPSDSLNVDNTLAWNERERLGQAGKNQFPVDWTLVRQSTLLHPVGGASEAAPNTLGLNSNILADKIGQVAGMPATTSVFRTINRLDGRGVPTPTTRSWMLVDYSDLGSSITRPQVPALLSSGIVDVATVSLAEVRATVIGQVPPSTFNAVAPGTFILFPPAQVGVDSAVPATRNAWLASQQAWMADAMPTDSRQPTSTSDNGTPEDPKGARIRIEPEPQGLLDVLDLPSTTPAEALSTLLHRSDSQMLVASGLVAHCSEFAIDWSLGEIDDNGDMVWYGNGKVPGAPSAYPTINGNPRPASSPLPAIRVPINDPTLIVNPNNPPPETRHELSTQLIYGFTPTGTEPTLTTYFGMTDPTYSADRTNDGDFVDGLDSSVASVPWRWPRLIRCTVTIADPQKPQVESTFQFIFKMPADPGLNQ